MLDFRRKATWIQTAKYIIKELKMKIVSKHFDWPSLKERLEIHPYNHLFQRVTDILEGKSPIIFNVLCQTFMCVLCERTWWRNSLSSFLRHFAKYHHGEVTVENKGILMDRLEKIAISSSTRENVSVVIELAYGTSKTKKDDAFKLWHHCLEIRNRSRMSFPFVDLECLFGMTRVLSVICHRCWHSDHLDRILGTFGSLCQHLRTRHNLNFSIKKFAMTLQENVEFTVCWSVYRPLGENGVKNVCNSTRYIPIEGLPVCGRIRTEENNPNILQSYQLKSSEQKDNSEKIDGVHSRTTSPNNNIPSMENQKTTSVHSDYSRSLSLEDAFLAISDEQFEDSSPDTKEDLQSGVPTTDGITTLPSSPNDITVLKEVHMNQKMSGNFLDSKKTESASLLPIEQSAMIRKRQPMVHDEEITPNKKRKTERDLSASIRIIKESLKIRPNHGS